MLFCGRHRNPIKPTVNDILAYLGSIHQKGLKFSAFQTARAAINNFVRICGGSDFSSHFLIKKFMQGIFNMKPSLPKYDSVWDVQLVLRYIEKQDKLTLLELSAKLCMLFLLVTAQRCQTLHLIEIENIEMKDNIYVIKTRHKLKQTRPGYHLKDIILQPYDKPKLCIVKTLKEYLIRTEGFRIDEKKLLISTQTPHKGVSKETVSQWVKQLMLKAGINKQFGVHSTRAVANSTAKMKGVPIETIMKTAGWTNAKTFKKNYHKQTEDAQGPAFQDAILS